MTRILSKASDERVTRFASDLDSLQSDTASFWNVRLYGNCIAYRGSIPGTLVPKILSWTAKFQPTTERDCK